jgi:hypothetical protein
MSDYICADNFKRRPHMKPKAKLIGVNGNVFNLLSVCGASLRCYPNAFNELRDRVTSCSSCDEALQIMMEYVVVC